MSTKKYVMFHVKFPSDLENWKKGQIAQGKKGSQKEFARQVGVQPYYVTDWKTGRSGIPYTYIDKICEVLGVDPDRYEPTTHGERYENSKDFITEIGRKNIEFAKDIGLDMTFVDGLTKIVDFNENFPLYAPIKKMTGNALQGYVYSRSTNADSAQIDKELQFLQVEQDGKLKTMHDGDLAFLKEVQDQVADYVMYLFNRRQQEMKREVEQFNADLTPEAFDEAWIRPEYILDHDRFAWVFEDIYNPDEKEGK